MASMGTMLEVDKLRDDADRNGAARVRKTRDSAIQKAHPTSDGEMEGGAEGEAQGAVHSWDRPGTASRIPRPRAETDPEDPLGPPYMPQGTPVQSPPMSLARSATSEAPLPRTVP